MKAKELREIDNEELMEKESSLGHELFNLRFRVSTRQLVNHNEIRRVKKDIARIKTVLRERELEIE